MQAKIISELEFLKQDKLVSDVISILFQDTEFRTRIAQYITNVLADKKIDAADVPAIAMIIIDIGSKIDNVVKNFNRNTNKQIIKCVILHILKDFKLAITLDDSVFDAIMDQIEVVSDLVCSNIVSRVIKKKWNCCSCTK